MTRFPRIQVSLRSRNPLALVAAVREQMRLAAVEPETIRRFSDEALSQGEDRQILEVCGHWVDVRSMWRPREAEPSEPAAASGSSAGDDRQT